MGGYWRLNIMDTDGRLDDLKQRHATLKQLILDEDQRPRPDADRLARLKVEKLHIKDEIEKLLAPAN
jgi:hypothetical protein